MRATRLSSIVECRTFRDFVYHYLANELAEADRVRLQEHLDACPRCAQYLEFEDAFTHALRSRLPRLGAPEELERRVKDLLRREGSPPRRRTRWVPYLGALAATLLLAALLAPLALFGRREDTAPTLGAVMHVVRAATVVDEECDRAGASIERQRSCREATHLNVLKLADGSYWSPSLDGPLARQIVADVVQRGRRLVVEGDLYPTIRTLHLTRLRDSQLGRL